MKKSYVSILMVLALLGLAASVALAGTTATQTVTYSVSAINEISASGDPAALNITTAVAGSEPSTATNAVTTYSISTNETGKKITAVINTDVAAGTLKINLADPDGAGAATSLGDVTLSSAPADCVTGIDSQAASAKTITYKFSAVIADGIIGSTNKTVTLTLMDEA